MHRFMPWLMAILLVALASVAAADPVIAQAAIETQPLDLKLTFYTTGLVYAVECDECKPMQLVVTGTTKATFAGRPIALTALAQYSDLGATIFYDKASRTVTRIEVWQ